MEMSMQFMLGFWTGLGASKEEMKEAVQEFITSDNPEYVVGIMEGFEQQRKAKMQQGWEEDITIDK